MRNCKCKTQHPKAPLTEPCFSFDYRLENAKIDIYSMDTLTDELTLFDHFNGTTGRSFLDLSRPNGYFRILFHPVVLDWDYVAEIRHLNVFTLAECEVQKAQYERTINTVLKEGSFFFLKIN